VKTFGALILAAGLSSRMGQSKALLPLGSQVIIQRLVSIFQQNDVTVYVVTGYQGSEIKKVLSDSKVTLIENIHYREGMFTSVQAGARAIKPSTRAFFIMPVDVPAVKADTIQSLIDKYNENPGKIIYPVFQKRRGHPPLIPGKLASTISSWAAGSTLRDVLNEYRELAIEVDVEDEGILLDIDTIEDYDLALKILEKNVKRDN
jgi:molybdenum cofactor cytidylyltransferase